MDCNSNTLCLRTTSDHVFSQFCFSISVKWSVSLVGVEGLVDEGWGFIFLQTGKQEGSCFICSAFLVVLLEVVSHTECSHVVKL